MASAHVLALQNEERMAYAVLSDNNTVLTFYYDDQKTARNGMDVGPFRGYPEYQSWYGQRESITSVVFDDSFAGCTTLTSTAYWFYFLENLSTITGIGNLKTDNVTDMSGMFRECRGLTSLDVSKFKTDNVTKMGEMFNGCRGLTSLDVSKFKTDKVTSMSSMFSSCSSLKSLDVTNFKTDNVTNMSSMFYGCSGLTSLDVSNFKTDNVWDMNFMFAFCPGLTSLDVSNFKTDNVMFMGGMFNSCSGLTSLDVSNFKTDKVTDMMFMFTECSSLKSLDVTNFKTDNVTNMRSMFSGCSGLTSLDVTGFNTENVTDISAIFSNCSGLTSLDVSKFKTDNVTDMMYMFNGCSGLKTIYVGDGWSTAKVQNGESMFKGCTSLVGCAGTHYNGNHIDHTYARIDGGNDNPGYFTAAGAEPWQGPDQPSPYAVLSDNNTVLTFYYDDQKTARNGMDVGPFTSSWVSDINRWNVSSGWDAQRESITSVVFDASFAGCTTLTSTAYLFYGFKNLSSITGIGNLKTDNVTVMNDMFYDCSSLTSLDVTGFKTDNVTNMFGMFYNCSGLSSLDLRSFKTDNVTEMTYMFAYCSGLKSLDVTGFKTDKVTRMAGMFYDCSGLKSLDVTGFKTDNVWDMAVMFDGCRSLTSLDVTGFKTDNVTLMYGMFRGCRSLTGLDVTGFKTDNVTRMENMFSYCSSLKTIYAGDGWSTAKIQDGELMFEGCTSLVGGAGTTYDADHTDHAYAHIDDGASNPGYFTGKNATPVEEDVDVITIKDIGKTTWCSEYDLDFTNVAGIKAYTATGYDDIDKTIWLTRVMKVPAGTGILVKGDAGSYKIPHSTVRAVYANFFKGNLGEAIKIEETDGDKTNYYLSGKDGTFVSVNGNANIGKNKAYLQLPTSVFAGTRSIGISYDDEDGTTGINVQSSIQSDNAYYTLQGQRVAKPGKGLYIHNGKKVVIK